MKDTNIAILTGRIGSDPDERTFESGSSVVSFVLATSDDYKKDDEWVEQTYWVSCQSWSPWLKKKILKMSKGDKVLIEGKITTNKRDDTKYTNLQVQRITNLGGKTTQDTEQATEQATEQEIMQDTEEDEELPF